jgi:hypothetical protein
MLALKITIGNIPPLILITTGKINSTRKQTHLQMARVGGAGDLPLVGADIRGCSENSKTLVVKTG